MLKLSLETIELTKKIAVIYLILIPLIYLILTNFQLYWYNTDLCQDYISAKNLVSGKSIYLPNDCWGYRIIPLKYNPHPPFAIYPFLIFTLIPQGFANLIWGALLAIFFTLSLVLILKAFKAFRMPILALLLALSVFWDPFRNSTINQNTSQLTLLLLTAAWYLELKKKNSSAGFLIGIASLLRFWPAIYLLFAVLSKKFKLVSSALLTIIFGFILTLIINGPDTYIYYFNTVLKEEDLYILNPDNISFVGLSAKVLFNTGLNVNQSIFFAKLTGLLLLMAISCIIFLITRNKLINQKSYIIMQSINLNILVFVFPIYWGWGLLIYVLIYAMVIYVLKFQKQIPLIWKSILTGSVLMLFVFKIFVPRYLSNDPSFSIIEFMRIIDVHTIISLFGATQLLIFQIWLLTKIKRDD